MPGPVFKGFVGLSLTNDEPVFDAETGVRMVDRTWAGSKTSVFGARAGMEADNISYRIGNTGPVYFITARIPINDATQENLDRYEIKTESQDKSIFEHPTVLADSEAFDLTIAGSGADTYRKRAEDAVETEDTGPTATWQTVVRHLKAGVTGFQIDFIVLSRFRIIDLPYAYGAGKFNLDDSKFFYTTAQLQLPQGVAFSIPATPADPSADYTWGWRRRGQRVEIVGTHAEQTIELVFAPWSTLLYEAATSNLAW